MHPDAGGMLNQLLGRREYVHFVSFAWDFEGVHSTVYPHLNFKRNKLPFELHPGETEVLSVSQSVLFPNKQVVDSVNICLVFFKTKNREDTAGLMLTMIERVIRHSLLQKTLVDAAPSKLLKNPLQLNHYAKVLQLEIEKVICENKMKNLGAVNFSHRVEDESNFYGEETIVSDNVRIGLIKSRN